MLDIPFSRPYGPLCINQHVTRCLKASFVTTMAWAESIGSSLEQWKRGSTRPIKFVIFFRSSCCVAVQASHFQPFVPPEFGLGGNSLSFSFEFSIGSRFIRNIFLPQQLLRLWQIGFLIHFESPLNLRTPCSYFAWTVALLGDTSSFPCPNLQIRT